MLRISEQFHASDLGRQRQGNEDNYFVRSPLFVVADGMGGAQAGEVASEMAVESFDAGLGDSAPAEGLVRIIQEANRRIHDRSRSDEQAAGMGTTCTAAYVGESDVTIAHVGDSRAYLWRGGELTRLTRDHSLVGELVARGKLTEEQAEAHPQRSVITRALGPEREVQVDVETFAARGGDVYLLCSDGLTSMIHEVGVRPVLERTSDDLEHAGRELVAAANAAGGRDNITVILFRLEDVGGAADGDSAVTATQPRSPRTRTRASTTPSSRARPARARAPRARTRTRASATRRRCAPARSPTPCAPPTSQEAAYRASGTVALSAIEPRARAEPVEDGPAAHRAAPGRRRQPERKRKKRRRRIPGGVVVALVLLAMVLGGFWLATQAVYFVGTDADRGNTVTIYRGLPGRSPARPQALQPLPGLRRHAPVGPRVAPQDVHGSQAALEGRCGEPRDPARTRTDRVVSARNRELMALIPASLLLTAGFAAIFIQQSERLSDVSLTYGAIFLLLCLAGHLLIRFTLPYADPYIFPLVSVLACFGLVVIYRIDETLAREQAQWFVVGLILFAATILLLRDFRVLERYRYTIALVGLLLLLLPRVPGIGQQVNGAYLGVKLGPVAFQPAEFGKIAIVIFLAAYLQRHAPGARAGPQARADHGAPAQAPRAAARRLGRGDVHARVHPRPRLVADVLRRLPRAALRRHEPALVRGHRDGRCSRVGAWFFASTVSHVQDRVDIWLDPFNPQWVEKEGYQLAQSVFAQADGGLFGTGFGASLLCGPGGQSLIPAPQTDLIYSVIVNEVGLVGACGLLLVYLLLVERGFKVAMVAGDSFSKLLASGLTAVFALQVFVIVGGVTRVIPLTGVTLPFVSYGGSSILANFVLVALLLLVSDRARRPQGAQARRGLR